jgi:hypothetical protein
MMAKIPEADVSKEVVKVNIALPKDIHRALKHWAIDNDDVPLATAAARVIEQFFRSPAPQQAGSCPSLAISPEPATEAREESQKRAPRGKKAV